MTTFEKILELVKRNGNLSLFPHLFLAIGLLLITPKIFGVTNLDEILVSFPLEMMVSLIGIILFTPIFFPEYDESTKAVVQTKMTSLLTINIIRTALALLSVLVLLGVFSLYLYLEESQITFTLYMGTLSNILFLGSLGMVASVLFKNVAVAYMLPILYYLINMGGGEKFKAFYLFSMGKFGPDPKFAMLITSIFLIFFSLIYSQLQNK